MSAAARTVAALLLAALALSACGKKPRTVDPPQGKDADTYPQTYPNPAFDPKPGRPQSGQTAPGQAAPDQAAPDQPMPGEVVPGWKFP